MEYLTVRETAEKWNLSPRMVQQLCTAGRIPDAQKFGKSWAIPADGGSPSEGTLALGSSAAQDLTADVYGRLYVFSGDGNVYRFTADEFLNPGTNLESVAIFSDSVHSVHCAYDGTLYGVSDQSLFVWRESSAASSRRETGESQ